MAKEKFVTTPLSSLPSSKRGAVHAEIVSAAPAFHQATVQGILDRVTAEFSAIEVLTGVKLLPIPASDTP
jgi:hypothetical protein